MNKKVLTIIPLCLIGFHGASQVTAQIECEEMFIPDQCQRASRININTNSKDISPPNICVSPGQTIEVNVTPDNSVVEVRGKNGGWPNQSGPSFLLTAPASGTYDYNVYFDDGTCIDPRIKVD